MKEKQPDIHAAIVEADQKSRERFSGHGSALAQGYNHIIMPLANPRDKHTQVIWGIRDFESRFGRKPEGMWLAETAADDETLDVLAEHGHQVHDAVAVSGQRACARMLDGEDGMAGRQRRAH